MKKPFTVLDLTKQISERTGFRRDDVRTLIELTFRLILEALVRGDYVMIKEFGRFDLILQEPRECLDPRNSKRILSNQKAKIKFQQSFKKTPQLTMIVDSERNWDKVE